MEDYCSKQLFYDEFTSVDLYYLLSDLYEWMIFWYGNEYGDLDEVYSKDELIIYVWNCIKEPGCELYVRVIK